MPDKPNVFRLNSPKAKSIDDVQRRADISFYTSAPWKKLRAAWLEQNPLCLWCAQEGRTTLAKHVDHIIERKKAPDRELDWSNLRSLCVSCHSKRHVGGWV